MTTYAVQRTLTGITMDQLGAAQQAAIQTAQQHREAGTPVRYIRSNFYPKSERCTCLFEAESAEAVERVNREAGIPFERVEEVLDLEPARS